MALDYFKTHTLLMAVQELAPAKSFLRDRYFPTNASTDVFATDDVLVEYKAGNKKLAPFVAPRKEGVTILRDGYSVKAFTPPYVAPQRPLTIDELNKKGFGEALFTNLTPEDRQNALIMKDLEEMGDMITRREEAMCAEVALTNGCVCSAMADSNDKTLDYEVHYYTEDANPSVYTPSILWNADGAVIRQDIESMVSMLTSRGLPASDLVVAPDVANAIIDNDDIQKVLDIRRYELGHVDPQLLPDGAALICVLNVAGRLINVISYDETYEAADGTIKQFIPAGSCFLSAPAAGRTVYGAVTQLEQEDGQFHTYAGTRVPKYLASAENNSRVITLKARPLPMPNNANAFVSATVL